MKQLSLLLLIVAMALTPSAMTNMHAATVAKVAVAAEHGSGQHGTAMLVQKGDNVVVTLTMSGIPAGVAEPAHIHPGTCTNLNPVPKYPLTNATNGTTTTTIKGVKLGSLLGGKYAINVHNADNLKIYVACGPIK
jgi:Cu/Zn superoxide dismutase